MKKITFLLLALSIGLFAQAQEVPETQSSLIIKKTATWCPPCGEWGWDLFENLIADNSDQAILWAMHYSGDLQSATAQGINTNLSGAGQPRFYLNNVDQGSSPTAIRNAVMSAVNQNAQETPLANAIATNVSVTNNELTLTVKSKFFAEATGDYYLNVYIVENEVMNAQAGKGDDAIHEKVLRDDMAGNAFGEILAQGTIMANTSFSTNFSIPIANGWNADHIELSTVIWKMNGSKYDFVNGTETQSIVAGINTPILEGAKMTVSPNPVSQKASISLDFVKTFDGELGVYDLTGRLIKSLVLGTSMVGKHTIELDASALLNGVYLLRLSNEEGALTRKVIISH